MGAIGVIASLVYLATQIKSASIAAKVDARLTTTGFMTEFNNYFIRDTEIYALWNRARKDSAGFDDDEFARFSNLNMNAFWLFSAAHYQKRMGTLDPGDWFELESIMKFFIQNEGVHAWWKRFATSRFDPLFVEYVNSRLPEWTRKSDS